MSREITMEELKALDMGDNDRRIDLEKRKRRGGVYKEPGDNGFLTRFDAMMPEWFGSKFYIVILTISLVMIFIWIAITSSLAS